MISEKPRLSMGDEVVVRYDDDGLGKFCNSILWPPNHCTVRTVQFSAIVLEELEVSKYSS